MHKPCKQEAADFLAECLVRKHQSGAAELIIHQEKIPEQRNKHTGLIIHVSATNERLFEIAQDMDLKKPDDDGVIREFRVAEAHKFPPTGVVGPLSLADVHKCILHAMESVHFPKDQTTLPGHPDVQVMHGAPVFSAYKEAGLIDMFPLHDDETLDKLYKEWKTGPLLTPPIDQIRNYFGENVALYISFTSFYTAFLIPTAIMGILQFCLDRFLRIDFLYSNVIFACLNLIAVTVFLEMWKRKSNEHAYFFGTAGKLRHKRPRPAFRGDVGVNPVTGREEVQYPIKKTMKKILFVSVPVTFLCLTVAFALMLLSFETEHMVAEYFRDPDTLKVSTSIVAQVALYVPSIVYSVLVFVMNFKYLHLAHWLTEWENHRTQEQFERYVVAKLVMFEFVNTFLALFYIAFYLQDIVMLKSQVFTMLIILQIVNQVQETLLPIFLHRPSTRRVMNKVSKRFIPEGSEEETDSFLCEHHDISNTACLSKEDMQLAVANFNLKRDPYESTYDDFMEMWLQFGYVFLFSSVYPLAAFFALINNIFELRMDAYKMCRLMRKPTPRGVRDIGAWYAAFSITSVISVMTNCTLLAMDKDVQAFAPHSSNRDWVLLFVGIEHIFLCIRLAINYIIPDVSSKVKHAMDKDDYLLKNRS